MTAISDYFRTALLIDDRVEPDFEPSGQPDGSSGKPNDVHEEDLSDEPQPGLEAPPDDDQTPVHPSSLVSAFPR